MSDHERLAVYQRAHALVLEIYRITEQFPRDHRYEIVSQLRRAAYSVPANLAEGSGRATTGDLRRFVSIARGSAQETRYFLTLSRDLGLLSEADHEVARDQLRTVERMLSGVYRSLGVRISEHRAGA